MSAGPVPVPVFAVRAGDELYRGDERRRVMAVTIGEHYVSLHTIRLRWHGGDAADARWFPDGDARRLSYNAARTLTIYPGGASDTFRGYALNPEA